MPYPVRRVELGGVPAFWAEQPPGLPVLAGLLFRVGRADEHVANSGVTHLAEHLALPAEGRGSVEFNGSVDVTTTTFWARGERDPVLGFIRDLAARVSELPTDHLDRERSILTTEASGRGVGHVAAALSLRYGARGPGLVSIDEYGLNWLAAKDGRSWAGRYFTRRNCALYLTCEPPDTFELALPEGVRVQPIEPWPIDYVRLPSVYADGPDGSVAASVLVRRSPAFMVAASVLDRRVLARLRHRLTYVADSSFEPLTAELAHAAVWVDCLPENVDAARSALLTELDELARTGPTDDERAWDLDDVAQAARDVTNLPNWLFWHAQNELLGGDDTEDALLRAERAAVTPSEAAEALRDALETLLLIIPEDARVPGGRFTPYPLDTPYRVEGRRHRRRGLRFRREGTERELIVGDEGLTLVGSGYLRTVRFRDIEAVLHWDDGERTIWAADATRVTIDPAIWRQGGDVVRRVDAATAADRVVQMEPGGEDAELAEIYEAADAGEPERALSLLEPALEREDESAGLHALAGQLYLGLKRWPEALRAANRAVVLDEGLELGHQVRAYALWYLGRPDEAMKSIHAALERDPSDLESLADFAFFAAEAGDEEDAKRAAERAIELYPESDEAWFATGWTAMAFGDWEAAERGLRRAVEIAPKHSMWQNNLGLLLLQRDREREALRHFDRALALDANNAHAGLNRAAALVASGRVEEGARLRRTLLEQDLARYEAIPSDEATADDLVLRGATLGRLGRHDEAAAVFASALALEPERADVQYRLALAQLDLGDVEAALRHIEEAAKLDSTSPHALYDQGYVGVVAGDPDLTGRARAEYAERYPRQSLASDISGFDAVARREWLEAAECFRTTLERAPLRSCSHAWLAVALSALGEHDAARKSAERAARYCTQGERCASLRAAREALDDPS